MLKKDLIFPILRLELKIIQSMTSATKEEKIRGPSQVVRECSWFVMELAAGAN